MDTERYAWSDLGCPPSYDPLPLVGFQGRITGRRLILAHIDGWVYDHRAWGEPEMDAERHFMVPVVTEMEWYHCHAIDKQPLQVAWWSAPNVWLEQGSIRF